MYMLSANSRVTYVKLQLLCSYSECNWVLLEYNRIMNYYYPSTNWSPLSVCLSVPSVCRSLCHKVCQRNSPYLIRGFYETLQRCLVPSVVVHIDMIFIWIVFCKSNVSVLALILATCGFKKEYISSSDIILVLVLIFLSEAQH